MNARLWLLSLRKKIFWTSIFPHQVGKLNSNLCSHIWGFPGGSEGKASACNAGDPGLIPRLGRSPGEGNGNPLQYSCLERIPRMEEPGRLQSTELQRVGHD